MSSMIILQDYTFQVVAMGSLLLGIVSGVLGCFAVLRNQSLLGDGISHAALPGIVIAFALSGQKNIEILLLGALLSGLLATLLIISIVRSTKIKFDAALALVMSVFFGVGLMLLSSVQKMPTANQAGLSSFIFGQASTLLKRDVCFIGIVGTVLLLLVLLLWKELKIFAFDKDFAKSLGFSTPVIDRLLSLMIVLAIIIGLQTVGVVLMSAMLITPAAAARQWTNKLSVMALLAALFGGISGVLGTMASSMVPKLPTGPSIVVGMSGIALFSMLFAPRRGLLAKKIRQRRMMEEIKKRAEEEFYEFTN